MADRWINYGPEDVSPGSWEGCISLLLSEGGPTVLYRGQRRHDWLLATSLERLLQRKLESFDATKYAAGYPIGELAGLRSWIRLVERRMLQRFQDLADSFDLPGLPPASDRLGWWELMQHHGCPTRLLDWTRSPFVGLWFAFDAHSDGDGDVALWILDERLCERMAAGLLLRVNAFPDTEFIDSRAWQNRLSSEAMESNFFLPIPIRPRHSLGRAAAQQSVLTLSAKVPLVNDSGQLILSHYAKRIRIRQEWKDDVLNACANLGHSRVSLYRDLDNIGAFVQDDVLRGEPDPLTGLPL